MTVKIPRALLIVLLVAAVAAVSVGATLLLASGEKDSAPAEQGSDDAPCITTPQGTELCGQAAVRYCDNGYDLDVAYKALLACGDAGLAPRER